MRFKKNFAAASLVICAFLLSSGAADAKVSEYAEGEVLVTLSGSYSINRFNLNDSASQTKSVEQRMKAVAPVGTEMVSSYNEISAGSGRTMAHLKSAGKTTDELIKSISAKSGVLGVFPNYMRYASAVPNDSLYKRDAVFRWGYDAANATAAWDSTTGTADVAVAVVDTGVKYDHHDLLNNIAIVSGLTGSYSMFNNGMGAWFTDNGVKYKVGNVSNGEYTLTYDEMKIGGHSANYSNKSFYGDVSGHGSHVAGIIGAVGNNGRGIAGMNWKSTILPVNVFTLNQTAREGEGAYDADIVRGLQYVLAVQKDSNYKGKVKVVNMSIGGWSAKEDNKLNNPTAQAIKSLGAAGVLVCIAAGNEEQNINNPVGEYSNKLPFPAAYGALPQLNNVLVVGASAMPEKAGKFARADYSNYSNPGKKDKNRYVDIFAPGSDIFSTVPLYNMKGEMRIARYSNGSALPDAYQVLVDTADNKYPGYQFMSGTSMATPMVSGAAALLAAKYPTASPKELKDMLCSAADPSILKKGVSSFGFMDVAAAVKKGGQIKKPTQKSGVSTQIIRSAFAKGVAFDENNMDFDTSADITALGLTGTFEYDSEAGAYYPSDDLTYDIAETLTGEFDEYYGVEGLPVFSLSSNTSNQFTAGDIVKTSFALEGFWLGESVGELRLAKVKTVSADARMLTYTMDENSIADGTFCVKADGAVLSTDARISSDDEAIYEIVMFTKDNGSFDLNPAAGKILDATVLYNVVASQSEEIPSADLPEAATNRPLPNEIGNLAYEQSSVSGGGGGGGCNGGFAFLAMFAAAPLFFRRKK